MSLPLKSLDGLMVELSEKRAEVHAVELQIRKLQESCTHPNFKCNFGDGLRFWSCSACGRQEMYDFR